MDPFRGREYVFESGLEHQALTVMIADPNVTELEEQLTPVSFLDDDKNRRTHCFDIRIRSTDGRRVAIAVKYEKDAQRDGLYAILGSISQQAFGVEPGGRRVPFADEYHVVTERHLDAVRVANARDVVSCGCDWDHLARDTVRGWLRTADRTFSLGTIGRDTGLGFRGFRAAVALVQSGAVGIPPGVRIGLDAVVENLLFESRPGTREANDRPHRQNGET